MLGESPEAGGRRRIACLLVPDLPLHAALRVESELRGAPLAIADGPGARARLLAVSPEARAQGVEAGATLPQARASCPGIELRVASPGLERSARETLLDLGLSLAPRAELAGRDAGPFVAEGAVYVDADGSAALHGRESGFASVLAARAERAGLPGVVAIASTRALARLAARQLAYVPRPSRPPPREAGGASRVEEAPQPERAEASIRILPVGRELEQLGPLPIDLLDPDDRTAQALTRFGIHRIRDLLRLPRRDLAARLGPELLALVARARGEAIEPPIAMPRATQLEEELDLEAPIDRLEPLAFVLRGLTSRLVERLTLRGLGCEALDWTLRLVDGRRLVRRTGVAAPTVDDRVLLRLLRLALESEPPPAAVEGVSLGCEGVPLRREQLDLFLPRGPAPSELDRTLAELTALCGEGRVGRPEALDDHRPDAFTIGAFRPDRSRKAPPPPTSGSPGRSVGLGAPRSGPEPARRRSRLPRPRPGDPAASSTRPPASPRLGLRALRPPLRARVRLHDGRPVFLRSAVSRGEIVAVAGPWRTTGHWWSESAHFAVDQYDVQMSDGCVLRLCFDWRTKRWQVDGLYD
ncbi:MAG: DNA polymerase Y family protein [Myxococcales bacterium]|nr:DNA polymerase Y family protein [Myxococcales bacterium]